MSFPDMAHVERLREALWQDAPFGNAAVMVGSGFSRNANPVSASSREMPTWADTACAMVDRLYIQSDQNDQYGRVMKEAGATSGFLRLAQEFEAAFGRTALNGLIRGMIPDEEYVPGELHQLLLELPWAEVLTTNWDTLLERGCTDVFNRNYRVVRALSEIPGSKRPRIVKLHGTLPANDPFIFTEEDYRTYPSKFAPFVNMVRQSMMENVFCLLGFSGDDPNFLHWSGWVRDHLTVLTQKIYLVGWLGLSPHRRRMLEERHVVPIDLAYLPTGKGWPSERQHQYATEWFLHMLHQGRPLPPYSWPEQGDPPRQPPPYLNISVSSVKPRPLKEPFSPNTPHATDGDACLEAVRATIDIWVHNRRCYPGWLLAPGHVRQNVWLHTKNWISEIVYPHSGMMPWERLFALEELTWRLDVALVPIFDEVAKGVIVTLDCVDVRNQKCRDLQGATLAWLKPDWTRARRCWRELALSVVRAARDDADWDQAWMWLERLVPFVGDDPDFACRVLHERCLIALARLDHEELEKLLDGWNTEHGDPFWAVRKAAFLAETNQTSKALTLVRTAIKTIRRNMKRGEMDLPNLSREGWTLFPLIALTFHLKYTENGESGLAPHERDEAIRQRWKELAVHHCDASADYYDLLGKLEKEPPRGPVSGLQEERTFDLGVSRQSLHFTSWGIEESGVLSAFQMKRLTEVAGLPSNVAGSSLHLCALRFFNQHPEIAVLLGWRLANSQSDKQFVKLFTRTCIARLQLSFVNSMTMDLLKLADYAFVRCNSHDGGKATYWVTRLRIAVELLSMLTPRLPVDEVHSLLVRACGYYQSDLFTHHPWLPEVLGHLFKRSLNALSVPDRYQHIPVLAALPIPGHCRFQVSMEDQWPDPFYCWPETPPHPAPMAINREMEPSVEELLSAMTERKTRKRAVVRLVTLYKLALLLPQQQIQFSKALWDKQLLAKTGLPDHTSFHDWAFLDMPEPVEGQAEIAFRSAYLDDEPKNPEEITLKLAILGHAVDHASRSIRPLVLSADDGIIIDFLIRCWLSNGIGFPAPDVLFDLKHRTDARNYLTAMGSLLMAVHLPVETATALLAAIHPLVANYPEVFHLYPGLCRSIPDQVEQAKFSLLQLLASDEESRARVATQILYKWSRGSRLLDKTLPPPPMDLVREIGAIIRVRRRATLLPALTFAIWIFKEGDEFWRGALVEDCLHGMRFLMNEADYDRSDSQPVTEDLPLLRCQCVRLAVVMSKNALCGDNPTIKQWLENAKDDPMAEVRNAI